MRKGKEMNDFQKGYMYGYWAREDEDMEKKEQDTVELVDEVYDQYQEKLERFENYRRRQHGFSIKNFIKTLLTSK